MRLTEYKQVMRNGDANNHIAVHHQLTNHNIDWDSAQCLTHSIHHFQLLILESLYSNLEQTLLNECQQLMAPYKWLICDGIKIKPTNGLLTDRLDLSNNRWTKNQPILLTNWPMTDDKLYTSLSANTITVKLTSHFQQTKLITSSTDKHYSLDSEDDILLRLSKRQSLTQVLFKTTLARKITQYKLLILQGPVPERRNNSIPGINVPYFRDNFIPRINSVPERRNSAIQGINLDKFITPCEVVINRYSRDKSAKTRWSTRYCLFVLLMQDAPDHGVLGFLMHI